MPPDADRCRQTWPVRLALIAVALLAALPAMAQSAFYDPPASALPGAPGSLIRQEPMSGAPLGASATRILYRSTGLDGQPIAVSGVVVVPPGPAPAGGWPVVAWAHPTTGIVPRCAPSLAIFLFQQIQGLRDMVARGYVVTATDYPGLGTAGPHPYLVGESEGRAVLDSIRAAHELTGGPPGKVALWGHSQGGQAVLFAGLLAHAYAPEIALAGLAAAAPATELGALMRADIDTPGGKNLLAMTLWSWDRVFGAPMDKVVVPAAIPEVDRLAAECLESPIDILPRRVVGDALQKRFLTVDDLTALPPWRGLLAENTARLLPPELPVFLAQGTADDTVIPAVTANYFGKLCADGSRVRMLMLSGVGHGEAAMRSATDAVAWIADRFAGAPPANDCPPR